MIWLTMLAMTAVIFLSRYLFLEPKLPLRLSKNTLQFLGYSAPAVLTAIAAPILFVRDQQLAFTFDNSYLICGLVAVLLAYFTRNTLLTVLVSMALFFIIH
ncbi:AzlD domain-containing protein [Shewanella halotolerans]|uniref:AzlD domain-containing protein n=1 Tax=Shewanella halotolerans TaxID=2864204 RepID=UPI001C65EF54|nr:AzlD domain-containing protein [Shewanella halotolerans]QYJ91926.1 AzlD domain-containing protein [Shewanella halotolerans]